jgi:signal transduction histidine kinase
VRPLKSISHAITQFTNGNLKARAKVKGLKEIQQISSNFNLMSEHLEEKRQDQLQFIASIAHDLRNPLNSMSMASELLVSQSEKQNQELSKIIFRQVKTLDRLVTDLLDTTRIEAGKLDIKTSEQDICALIKDLIGLHQTDSDLHGLTIELPEKALPCKCDIGRLSQVMNNLISNAIKYSPRGGTILIKAWQDGSEIHITVSDQGIGIDKEDLESIFKPFHRSKLTKSTIPGIGLGLSTSRRIVAAHGGKLWAESIPGKGSTFHVTLPRPIVQFA